MTNPVVPAVPMVITVSSASVSITVPISRYEPWVSAACWLTENFALNSPLATDTGTFVARVGSGE